jgi:hypothetical protein
MIIRGEDMVLTTVSPESYIATTATESGGHVTTTRHKSVGRVLYPNTNNTIFFAR